ncbi:hypothetical protein AG1IA_08808 [Rhizoctonia solani AG-1 IA]|uniref:Uncharacterized protein n=1 Tax=Thanatephorus cucumeris (strain AG1-IA) TaxID=983506 RepID=L8WGU7_THACA|nr:hypothetical protein AG1IA_08808 [Rhizoctonia solani AG-1 IA]
MPLSIHLFRPARSPTVQAPPRPLRPCPTSNKLNLCNPFLIVSHHTHLIWIFLLYMLHLGLFMLFFRRLF